MEVDSLEENIIWVTPMVTGKLKRIPRSPMSADPCLTQPPADIIELTGDNFIIGRILSSHCVFNSLQISRKHCILQYKDNKWWIQDVSTNGVGVNNKPLQKFIPTELFTHDVVNLIPGGGLSYKFEYTNNRTVEHEPHSDRLSLSPLPNVITIDSIVEDDGNVSDESESLLSIEIEDLLQSSSPVTKPPDKTLKKMDSKAEITDRIPTCNRPQKTAIHEANKGGWGNNPVLPNKSNEPMSVGSEEEDNEELLDLDDVLNVIPFLPHKVQSGNDPSDVTASYHASITSNSNSSVCAVTQSNLPSTPVPLHTSVESQQLDQQVLTRQLKYFTEQYKELKNDHKVLMLKSAIERDQLKQQIEEVKTTAKTEQSHLFHTIVSAMELELNCCICNEVYINATVIDCGHTFCSHCIIEWTKKKKECPVCRSVITKSSRQVDLNNFLLKMHSIFPPEIQTRRESLLKDRETEVSVANVVQTAEAEERAASTSGRQINRVMNAMEIDELELDFDAAVRNLIGLPQLDGRPHRRPPATRRSTRVRRVRTANQSIGNPGSSGADADAQMGGVATSRRTVRSTSSRGVAPGTATASASPDLITLDDH